MATTPDQTPPLSSSESPATHQARLRRERREAKIKAGGSARLDKITQLSGRPAPAPPSLSSALEDSSGGGEGRAEDDPDEVDISRFLDAEGGDEGGEEARAEMRRMLRGGGGEADRRGGGFAAGGAGFVSGDGVGGGSGAGTGEEDPMVRMLRQMMGGEGGGDAGLADLLAGGGVGVGGGMLQPQRGEGAPPPLGADWWRVGHAVGALALGVYVASVTAFSGSRVGRAVVGDGQVGGMVFWVFVTAELVLQSMRFFVERGSGGGTVVGGWLGVVMGVVPEPWKGWVGLGRRYGGIYTRVVEDAMVVVFVLGVKAWWMGGAVG